MNGCNGPCRQGREACPTPEACELPQSSDAPLRDLAVVLAVVAICWIVLLAL